MIHKLKHQIGNMVVFECRISNGNQRHAKRWIDVTCKSCLKHRNRKPTKISRKPRIHMFKRKYPYGNGKETLCGRLNACDRWGKYFLADTKDPLKVTCIHCQRKVLRLEKEKNLMKKDG